MRIVCLLLSLSVLALPAGAEIPSGPGIDSPELAFPGTASVGMRTLTLTNRGQVDPLLSAEAGHVVRSDRVLPLSIWYPAKIVGDQKVEPYSATLASEPPLPRAAFQIPAIAVRNAAPLGGSYPLVLLSHGYNNDPVMLSWLTENLATKGYVVVAISHNDPPITDRAKTPAAILQRPLDISFVLREIRHGLLGDLVDTKRVALAGYSMGGYGVLTAAGARLDPASPALKLLPSVLTERYVAGGADTAALSVGDLKAVVAISPAGGAPWSTWGDGIKGIRTPMLMIAGDADRRVGYEHGPAAMFADAVNADRYMLVFRGAGHNIGVDPVPAEMQSRIWDFDWFADPIWRKDRINAISLHFITAFLDLYVKGDRSRAAYLHVPKEDSDNAAWVGPDSPYGAVSQGEGNPTWKGFRRDHQDGLIFRHLDPAP